MMQCCEVFCVVCSYAMKEVSMVNCNVKEREDALNEVRLLSSITHPQIVKYYESFVENNKLYIVSSPH